MQFNPNISTFKDLPTVVPTAEYNAWLFGSVDLKFLEKLHYYDDMVETVCSKFGKPKSKEEFEKLVNGLTYKKFGNFLCDDVCIKLADDLGYFYRHDYARRDRETERQILNEGNVSRVHWLTLDEV